MTGPAADRAALDRIWDTATAAREQRAAARRQPPRIHLYDGNWTYRGQCMGMIDYSFEWKLNDTGAGQVTLPFDHHLARWAMAYWNRDTANIHVRVDKDGARWCGRLSEVRTEQDTEGVRTVVLGFLHDYEELKHITMWANPLAPAEAQFPKTFVLAGPAAYTIKLALFLNLVRLNMSLWSLPDDPLSFDGWTQGLDYKRWPIIVKPGSLLLDDSPWTILNSRFKIFDDVVRPALDDGRLMITLDRWFPGDPQPWPGAGLNRPGQLVVDVVDKSGWWGQTAIGGTIAGGLLRTGVELAEDLVDESRIHLQRYEDAEEYTLAGWLGIAPKQPWVVYRTNPPTATAASSSFTWQPATVGQITVGGHSSPGVNEAISASTKLVFNIIGSFFLQPGFGSIADGVLAPLYEDTLFAFMNAKNPLRTRRLGWSHYYENFADGADKAYTLSAIIALRSGFFDSRERTAHQMTIHDGAPYLVGDRGQGHFFLGDRVGGEIPGAPDGRVVVEQVTALTLAASAEAPHEWAITTGDPAADHDPLDYLIGRVRDLAAAAHDLGVI